MKKILNAPESYVDEMLSGLVTAHPEYYRLHGDSGKVIARAMPGASGKVGIVTGGGSGHLPVFTGYVGVGLLDSQCSIAVIRDLAKQGAQGGEPLSAPIVLRISPGATAWFLFPRWVPRWVPRSAPRLAPPSALRLVLP